MRSLSRTIVSAVVLTALSFGIGASTLAAESTLASAISSTGSEFTEEWCVGDGPARDCALVNAVVTVTSAPDGGQTARLTFRQTVTAHGSDGQPSGASRTSSFSRTVHAEGGRNPSFSVSLSHGAGDSGTCLSTYTVTVVKYDLLIEKLAGSGC
jgi:hypothetical protein